MDTIKIKVNDRDIEARAGQTILEVVHEQGLDEIPTLCHSPELEPYGSCFVCTVEVKGRPNLVPACSTRVAAGMEITTRSQRVVASRRSALELLFSNHYADCISPCQIGCPAGVDAQGYIALAAMGQTRRAIDLVREANPLPAVCGRVCVRKCEVVCRRVDIDQPVSINAVKRHISDLADAYDGTPEREPARGKSVGIVGAGPAGLTAAWFLARKGYDAVIYEAMPRSGGMLRYGIPTYRLPDDVLDREVDFICRAGAQIRYNVRVGQDTSLDELRRQHPAVFLGAGAWKAKPMRVAGEFETAGVRQGIDFLREKADDPSPVRGTVVVVGGGNTAMDVARTSWRCGAEKVIILYRRTKAEMPADEMEIHDCLEEGIEIMELAAPVGVVAEQGRLKALKCIRMVLGEPDSSGRRRPVPLEGSEFELPCHLAVSAIGQESLLKGLEQVGDAPITVSKWTTYQVDPRTMETNVPGVFAGGDAANDGPTVVIDAIRDGQRAARAIHAYLSGEPLAPGPFVVTKEFWAKPGKAELGDIKEMPRHEVHTSPVADRKGNFSEVALGFEPEDVLHEEERCLSCGCVRFYDCKLRLYGEQYGVDLEHYKGYVRKHRVDDRHPHIVYDPNKCILCGRCIRTCARVLPISALGLVNRGFRTEMRPAMNDPLVETSCVSCGNCVDACPTGALTVKYPFPGRAPLVTQETATHCAFCSLACPITVKRFGQDRGEDRYFLTASGTPGEYLCRYGRFGYERFLEQRRVRTPQVRAGSTVRAIGFDEAFTQAAAGLRRVSAEHGPQALAVFASPELTNEELYLAVRIAREGLGTNNVGSLAMLLTQREAGALDRSFGFTASTCDRTALRTADLIICNNTATEADHLILAVEIIDAVRRGARLIVANSILDTTDRILCSVALDPMRGRAAILWNGVVRRLLDEKVLSREQAAVLPGGREFLAGRLPDLGAVADLTGVDVGRIRLVVDEFRRAKRVVFVHCPDRPQDQAPGDIETLANFVLLLRAAGVQADLLLPRLSGNMAGLEVTGADPAFLPGRRPVDGACAGARTHAELDRLLAEGRIRGAVVVGEDPLEPARTGAWFQNIEFLVAIDWTPTETTHFADITLPGTTYLECEGTRCNFEGRVINFARAVTPPAGKPGWAVLAGLAGALGVGVEAAGAEVLTAELERAVRGQLGDLAPFFWNRGEAHTWSGQGSLVVADVRGKAASIPPAVTHGGRYKRGLREVGTERFRVR